MRLPGESTLRLIHNRRIVPGRNREPLIVFCFAGRVVLRMNLCSGGFEEIQKTSDRGLVESYSRREEFFPGVGEIPL